MLRIFSSVALALVIIGFVTNGVNAETRQELVDRIIEEVNAIGNKPRGCSAVLEHLEVLRVEHPHFHFRFAGRNDDTPTGMRGCGYGFHTDVKTALSHAMQGCRKWETEFGTDGGTKVCRFMD